MIGGEFRAKVDAQLSSRPTGDVAIRLRNLRLSGKSVATIWEAASTVAPVTLEQLGISRFAIPVRFQIPADVTRPTGDGAWWILEVQAPMPGLDYRTTFNVPVFDVGKTAERSDREADAGAMILACVGGIGAMAIAAASLRLFAKGSIPEFLSILSQIDEAAAWGLFVVGIALSLAGPGILATRNQKRRTISHRPQ